MKYARIIFVMMLLLMIVAVVPDVSAQCAMCRATVENNVSAGNTEVAEGLNKGILYLLMLPYLLGGALVYLWFRNSKRNKAKQLSFDLGKMA